MDTDSLSCLVGGEMCHQSCIPHLLSHAITSSYYIFVLLGTYYYNISVFVNNFFVLDNGCKEVAMKRIEEARNMRGMSQAKLAEAMGTSQQQVARFEKPGADVKASVLVKISEVCDVSVSWLLGLTDDAHGEAVAGGVGLTPDEAHLIRMFRECSPKFRSMLLDSAASYRDSSKERAADSASFDKAVNE